MHLIKEQSHFLNTTMLHHFKHSCLCLRMFNDHRCTKLVYLPVKVRTAGQAWRLTFVVF